MNHYKYPDKYYADHEFLFGDKIYQTSLTLIAPYKNTPNDEHGITATLTIDMRVPDAQLREHLGYYNVDGEY